MIDSFPGLVALQTIYETHVWECVKCGLAKERTEIVFGHGCSEKPPIAFVGEAPGKDEDEQGYPFVGRAGQVLTNMINAMGLKREEVYILNSVCCRPPGNRNPAKEEQAACWSIMASQLRAVRPEVIVVLGGQATRSLLRTDAAVGDLRRKWHSWNGTPVRVTYHPSYLLRNPPMKVRTWADMTEVLAKLGRKVPDRG